MDPDYSYLREFDSKELEDLARIGLRCNPASPAYRAGLEAQTELDRRFCESEDDTQPTSPIKPLHASDLDWID